MSNDKVSVRDLKRMLQNPFYKEYWEEKQEIKSKYPPPLQMNKEEWETWKKEIGDLIFRPNGSFQQFLWDTLSDQEKLFQDRRARGGRKKHTKAQDEYNE